VSKKWKKKKKSQGIQGTNYNKIQIYWNKKIIRALSWIFPNLI